MDSMTGNFTECFTALTPFWMKLQLKAVFGESTGQLFKASQIQMHEKLYQQQEAINTF
jgi:hypothetical protein